MILEEGNGRLWHYHKQSEHVREEEWLWFLVHIDGSLS
jgi:hypothetical protein